MSRRRWVPAIRVAAGGVFLLAGSTKLVDLPGFADRVDAHGLAPSSLSNLVAIAVPGVESVVGLLLVLGAWTRSAAWVAGVMASVFGAVTGWALWEQLNIDCGCFGSLAGLPTWVMLLIDILLLVGCIIVVKFAGRQVPAEREVGCKEIAVSP